MIPIMHYSHYYWAGGPPNGFCMRHVTLRVQVPNILTQNLYYDSYYPKPKYPIIGYLDH